MPLDIRSEGESMTMLLRGFSFVEACYVIGLDMLIVMFMYLDFLAAISLLLAMLAFYIVGVDSCMCAIVALIFGSAN